MAQPLCSAPHTLCGHLEPPPTSEQGLEGAPGVTGGLQDTGTVQDCGNVEWQLLRMIWLPQRGQEKLSRSLGGSRPAVGHLPARQKAGAMQIQSKGKVQFFFFPEQPRQ